MFGSSRTYSPPQRWRVDTKPFFNTCFVLRLQFRSETEIITSTLTTQGFMCTGEIELLITGASSSGVHLVGGRSEGAEVSTNSDLGVFVELLRGRR